MTNDRNAITDLLQRWQEGDSGAEHRLLNAVYGELRRRAHGLLRNERDSHTYAPSDLVHETYLRIEQGHQVDWQSRHHFFAIASRTMRRLLIEHARRRLRVKRGAGQRPVPLEDLDPMMPQPRSELIALDDALESLERIDPFKVQLVELRFFGGFTVPETAVILDCSQSTIERHWRIAQGWLFAQMQTSLPATGAQENDRSASPEDATLRANKLSNRLGTVR